MAQLLNSPLIVPPDDPKARQCRLAEHSAIGMLSGSKTSAASANHNVNAPPKTTTSLSQKEAAAAATEGSLAAVSAEEDTKGMKKKKSFPAKKKGAQQNRAVPTSRVVARSPEEVQGKPAPSGEKTSTKTPAVAPLAEFWTYWQQPEYDRFREGDANSDLSGPCSEWSIDRAELTVTYHKIPKKNWAGSLWLEPAECEKKKKRPDEGYAHRRYYEFAGEYYFEPGKCPTSPEQGCPKPTVPEACIDGKNLSIGQCCRQRGVRMLHMLAEELAARKVDWFLDAGTMLGAIRDSGYIPYDYDIDIVADYEQANTFYQAIGAVCQKTGAYIVTDPWTPRKCISPEQLIVKFQK